MEKQEGNHVISTVFKSMEMTDQGTSNDNDAGTEWSSPILALRMQMPPMSRSWTLWIRSSQMPMLTKTRLKIEGQQACFMLAPERKHGKLWTGLGGLQHYMGSMTNPQMRTTVLTIWSTEPTRHPAIPWFQPTGPHLHIHLRRPHHPSGERWSHKEWRAKQLDVMAWAMHDAGPKIMKDEWILLLTYLFKCIVVWYYPLEWAVSEVINIYWEGDPFRTMQLQRNQYIGHHGWAVWLFPVHKILTLVCSYSTAIWSLNGEMQWRTNTAFESVDWHSKESFKGVCSVDCTDWVNKGICSFDSREFLELLHSEGYSAISLEKFTSIVCLY